MSSTRHVISRQRHENARRRTLTVSQIADITPKMRRITLTSPELADFESAGADDHIKLFFSPSDNGEAPRRSFTPRAYDQKQQTLVIDFALHNKGPATEWAGAAKEGSILEIGGPRGSAIVPDDFDWYVFIGDESALPAIGRWVELPAGDGFVFIAGERQLARTLRHHFVAERQHPEAWIKASDYWSLSDDE